MKFWFLSIYIMIGLGVAIDMEPHETAPKLVFAARLAAWPVLAGITVSEVHRSNEHLRFAPEPPKD